MQIDLRELTGDCAWARSWTELLECEGEKKPGHPRGMARLACRPGSGEIGVPDAFHALSHHANDEAKKARLVQIQRVNIEKVGDSTGAIAQM